MSVEKFIVSEILHIELKEVMIFSSSSLFFLCVPSCVFIKCILMVIYYFILLEEKTVSLVGYPFKNGTEIQLWNKRVVKIKVGLT